MGGRCSPDRVVARRARGVALGLVACIVGAALTSGGCGKQQADAIYLTNEAVRLYRKGQVNAALTQLERAVRVDPSSDMAHYNLGLVASVGVQDHERARRHLEVATRLNPRNVEAWYQLGKTYGVLGKVSDAGQAYNKAIQADPYHAPSLYELGMIAEQDGNLVEADRYYRQVIIAEPKNPYPFHALAEIYARTGFFDAAEAVYREGIRLNPADPDLQNGLGVLLVRRGKPDAGIEHLLNALRSDGDLILAHFNLSMAYLRSGDIKRAKEQLKRFLARSQGTSVDAELGRIARLTLKRLPEP